MVKLQKIKNTAYKFPVIIEKDEDGFFVADCPDLQGCHSQGSTIEEAITNIRDAIELNIKILKNEFIRLLNSPYALSFPRRRESMVFYLYRFPFSWE